MIINTFQFADYNEDLLLFKGNPLKVLLTRTINYPNFRKFLEEDAVEEILVG